MHAHVEKMADLCARETHTLSRNHDMVASFRILLSPEARVVRLFFAIHPVDAHISDGQQNTWAHKQEFMGQRDQKRSFIVQHL